MDDSVEDRLSGVLAHMDKRLDEFDKRFDTFERQLDESFDRLACVQICFYNNCHDRSIIGDRCDRISA